MSLVIHKRFIYSLLLSHLLLSLNTLFGQETQPYIFKIKMENNEFSGEGIDWLFEHQKDYHFYLFGEQHGIKPLGDYLSFTLDRLKRAGSYHLGLEMDPWTTYRINSEGTEAFISKFPNSIAFGYDGELKMIAKAMEEDFHLIGLDQMLTAIHPFQRLIELSNNSLQTRLVRGAFLKASLKMGEYLREEHFEDIKKLKAVFSDHKSPEVHQILKELESSMRIYTTWRAGQRGEVAKQLSPKLRESMMKNKFDQWLDNNYGYKTDKALFKMGGAHMMYGIGPNGIQTLGEHIRQKALKRGLQTFSVGIRNFDVNTAFVTDNDFGEAEAIVVDVKKLRDNIVNDTLVIRNYDLNRLSINGYDAIIYFKNSKWSRQKKLSKYKETFKSRLINSLIPMAGLFILCLVSVLVYVARIFKRNYRSINNAIWFSLISTILLCSLFVYQIIEIRNTEPESANLCSANTSLCLFILLGVLSMTYLFLAIKHFIHYSHTVRFKIYYLLMAIAYSSLVGYCYYWNIGGMI